MKLSDLKEILLQDPEIRAEYDALEQEFELEHERIVAKPDALVDALKKIDPPPCASCGNYAHCARSGDACCAFIRYMGGDKKAIARTSAHREPSAEFGYYMNSDERLKLPFPACQSCRAAMREARRMARANVGCN